MRHRVTLASQVRTQLPNHEYETTWQAGPTQPGLLMMGGAHVAEIAAARGVKADGTLRLALGAVCLAGQRATVTGIVRGRAWTRTVLVTSGTDETNRLFGLATVVDVDLNR